MPNLFTSGSFFKKIKGVYDKVVGTATVVCPEVIINKNWNPDSQYVGDAMKVPSKNFYDYLSPWLAPDPALKSGNYTDRKTLKKHKGVGLGQDPYNNDLTRALDREEFSNPGPIAMSMDYQETGEVILNGHTYNDNMAARVPSPSDHKYRKVEFWQEDMKWEGDWGDVKNGFQTGVALQIYETNFNQKVPGGVSGSIPEPTGSFSQCWIGSKSDQTPFNAVSKAKLMTSPTGSPHHKTRSSHKTFYNQHFATGFHHHGNGTQGVDVYMAFIPRRPYDEVLRINAMTGARAGSYKFVDFKCKNPSIDVCLLGECVSVSVPLCMILDPIIKVLNEIFKHIFGKEGEYTSESKIRVTVLGRQFCSIDGDEFMHHPVMRNWHPTDTTSISNVDPKEFNFTQFYYPNITKNPLFAYAKDFNWKEPYFKNEVIENGTYNDRIQIEHPLLKKYKYFTPSLFSLLYETNIGVFYDQLTKQMQPKGISLSYHTKTSGGFTADNPNIAKEKQKECLADILFPTNLDKWNSKLENGWGDHSAKNTSHLKQYLDCASIPASPGSALPGDYASALGRYGISGSSFGEIDNIIGSFSLMKGLVDANGSDVDKWTQSANTHYKALSTGSPKNLAVKLAQFICWYLEPNGVAERTRTSVRALYEYEKHIDEQIDDYRKAAGCGANYKKYHIVGTDKYGRECDTEEYNYLTNG